MLLRGMVDHEVQQYFDSSFMCLFQQIVKILKSPIFGVNAHVIGDIIAVVFVWGLENGGDPNGIDPESLQIVQSADYTVDVPVSISV